MRKSRSFALLLAVVAVLLPTISVAAPPQVLWHLDLPDAVAKISAAGNTVVVARSGYRIFTTTFEVHNGPDGALLWSVTLNGAYWNATASDDGQTIAMSVWPKDPDAYYEDEYLEAVNLTTRVYNRAGTLLATIPGGLAAMSGDGNRLYIHGIPLPPEQIPNCGYPDCTVQPFKHGLFTKEGVELWSHILNVPGFEWEYLNNKSNISYSGNTVARECGIYKMKDSPLGLGWQPVVPCRVIAFDGATGSILWRKYGAGSFSVSPDGTYVSTGDSTPLDQPWDPNDPKELVVWNRSGNEAFRKVFESPRWGSEFSPDTAHIAAATRQNLHWLDMQGNILWSAPIPAELFAGQISISSDNHVVAVQYTCKTLCPEPHSKTAIVNALTGQIVHTFDWDAVITADGTKALVVNPSATGFVELWDISPLFQ